METLNSSDYEKYKMLFEAIGKCVVFTDIKGIILDYSSFFLDVFKIDKNKNIKKRTFSAFLDSKDKTKFTNNISKLDLNAPHDFYVTALNNGTKKVLNIEATKLFLNNNIFIILLISEAVDTANLNPHKIKNLSETEKSNVLYAMEIASSYLANIYKKTAIPIEKIKNYCSLLEKEMNIYGLSKFSKDLKNITSLTKDLNSIINDLAISPLAVLSNEENYIEKINLTSLLEEVATIVNIIAKRKNITLVILYPPDIGTLYANKLCLFYCLINTLDNIFHLNEYSYISLSIIRKKENTETLSFEINISPVKTKKKLLENRNFVFSKECVKKLNGKISENNISETEKLITLQFPAL